MSRSYKYDNRDSSFLVRDNFRKGERRENRKRYITDYYRADEHLPKKFRYDNLLEDSSDRYEREDREEPRKMQIRLEGPDRDYSLSELPDCDTEYCTRQVDPSSPFNDIRPLFYKHGKPYNPMLLSRTPGGSTNDPFSILKRSNLNFRKGYIRKITGGGNLIRGRRTFRIPGIW